MIFSGRSSENAPGRSTLEASSTSADPNDLGKWDINGRDPVEVAHKAYATLRELPELK
jgi:hypothetical protein